MKIKYEESSSSCVGKEDDGADESMEHSDADADALNEIYVEETSESEFDVKRSQQSSSSYGISPPKRAFKHNWLCK